MPVHSRKLFTPQSRFEVVAATADKPATLNGYACVWGEISTDPATRGFRARLSPGSASFTPLTHALFCHDYRYPLGDTVHGSLRLTNDDVGVRFEIDLPRTSYGSDVQSLVTDRRVRGMSFFMQTVTKYRETPDPDGLIIDVDAFTLNEITVTPTPSFDGTSVEIATTENDRTPATFAARTAHKLRATNARFQIAGATLPVRIV